MNPIFQNLRVGKRYVLRNYGETTEFLVLRRLSDTNFLAKNTLTLEKFELASLVEFGVGGDFYVIEIVS
jgi:hypothetical protein